MRGAYGKLSTELSVHVHMTKGYPAIYGIWAGDRQTTGYHAYVGVRPGKDINIII